MSHDVLQGIVGYLAVSVMLGIVIGKMIKKGTDFD